jgi:lysophospholipase L1-like esterase
VKKGTYSFAYYDANKTYISGASSGTALTTPSNCAYVRISQYKTMSGNVAGINEEQLELGTVSTDFEKYGFSLNSLIIPKDSSALQINLPSKIYALVGQELNIYFDNIINDKDTKYDFDITCNIGTHYANYYRVVPTAAGSYTLTVAVLQNDLQIATATTTLIVTATSVGNAITRNVLIIGDSTTDNDYLASHLNGNFTTDVMKINTIGTRGTTPNKHEGHAGWKTDDFMGQTSNVSPFVFNGAFDFSQYISSNGLLTPDYVFINLGINDVFSITDDASLDTKATDIVNDYNTMISNIKTQNANVKIGVCITIPPNYSQDAFGTAYGTGQTRRRYKRNNFLLAKKLIASFGGREAENIYLVPIYANLDTRNNFVVQQKQINARNTTMVNYPTNIAGVHPAESGYWQIADSYWYFLKSFEV